jgi:hypothetical protein
MPKFSSWREGSAARRVERQAPAAKDVPKTRGTRDTKRWCRGRLGVEHRAVVKTRSELGKDTWSRDHLKPLRRQWLIRFCTVCGKEIDHYYPFGTMIDRPPPWALEFIAEREAK